jgi:thioredoxin-like negative regulator of GroEL
MEPIVNRLKNEYDGKIVFARYDIDAPASQEIVNKYRITGVPTFVALNGQQEEISRLSGGFPYSDLKKKLDRFVTE